MLIINLRVGNVIAIGALPQAEKKVSGSRRRVLNEVSGFPAVAGKPENGEVSIENSGRMFSFQTGISGKDQQTPISLTGLWYDRIFEG